MKSAQLSKTKSVFADLGLLYAAAIWGTTFTIVKDSLGAIDPVILVGYRFTLAAVVLAVVLLVMKRPLWKSLKQGVALGFVLWMLYLPQTIGLRYTTASNSAFITGLFVAFLPPLSMIMFREKTSLIRWIAVLVSLAGLWVLTGGMSDLNTGDSLTLITAMAYALHVLLADHYVKNGQDPYALAFQQFLTVGVLSLIAGAAFTLPFSVGSGAVSAVVFLALFPTLSAFVIQLVAQRWTTPVKVALIFALEPVFAALYAWTLGNEPVIFSRAAGGLLIVAAIILAELPIGRAKKVAKDVVV